MKIGLRILAFLYLLNSFRLVISISAMRAMYSDFGVEFRVFDYYLMAVGVLIWGVVLAYVSFDQKIALLYKKVILVVSILAPIAFSIYSVVLPVYNLTS